MKFRTKAQVLRLLCCNLAMWQAGKAVIGKAPVQDIRQMINAGQGH